MEITVMAILAIFIVGSLFLVRYKKADLLMKVVLSIVVGIVLAAAGVTVLLFGAFDGGGEFYLTWVLITAFVLFFLIVLRIFNLGKAKNIDRFLIACIVIAGLAMGGYKVYEAYVERIPIVNEQGVDLTEYRPFADGTKAVSLNGPSTLKIDSDLPKVDGATALYPLYSAFIRATYPQRDYDPNDVKQGFVTCTTTPDAYTRLINGEVDMIFAAAPSQAQLEEARGKGVELKLTPIGREAFVFFVNRKNSLDSLTIKQIQSIYSGVATNWIQLGGKDQHIRAFQRPENSGSQTMLQKLMEDKPLMIPPKEDVVAGMGGIIKETANYRNYKNAIGYSFLYFATRMVHENQIKLLKINGIYPDLDTIKSGEYPLVIDFYAVTAGSGNPNVEPFINWVLSEQGQHLVKETGYTPIGGAAE